MFFLGGMALTVVLVLVGFGGGGVVGCGFGLVVFAVAA